MEVNEVLREIIHRITDIVMRGGRPEKIIVSEKVYDILMHITLMPRSVRYENSTFFIADIPVEKGNLTDPRGQIWFRIV